MNYLVPSISLHLEPRREVSLKPSAVTAQEPRAGGLPRALVALSVRRRQADASGPDRRPSASRGVSPIAGGATRGVAFLVGR